MYYLKVDTPRVKQEAPQQHENQPTRAPPCWHALSCSVVSDSATAWTAALQAPLSMGFSRQEHCSGLPCPPPGDLPDPGIKPVSLMSPALAARLFTTSATWQTPRKTCSDLHWSLLNTDTPKLKFWSGFLPQTGRQLGKMPWILQWQFRNFGSEEDKWILQPHILLFLLIGWYAYILFPHHILRGFEIAC